MNKLVIIAGKGNLSRKLIHASKGQYELLIIALYNETDPDLIKDLPHIWIKLGEVGKAIGAIKDFKAKKVLFVGSVDKPDILNLKVDTMGAKLLAKIAKDKIFGDNKILSSLTDFLTQQDLEVVGAHEILKDLVVSEGVFTLVKPNEQEMSDIKLAKRVTHSLGELDIGQATIIENGIILGVEAAEGTDNLIKRCAELKKIKSQGGLLVKFSKPNQETRIDLPTIGIETIRNIHAAKFKGIAIEAHKSIFLDKEEVISYANANNLFVIAI